MRRLFVLVCAVVAVARIAAAEPRRAPVVAATVYPEGAEVVRMLRLRLEPGRPQLRIAGLPEKLDPASLRVAVKPGDVVDLEGLATREVPQAELAGEREAALVAEIERIENAIQREEDRIRAAEVQLKLIERIGRTAADIATRELELGRPDPKAWRRSWEAVGAGAAEILELIRQSEISKRALERELDARKRELEAIRTGARGYRELTLDLEVEEATEVTVEIRHFVAEAGWEPLYDVHLRTRKREVTLQRRARVWQRTGEDWREVALRLSTARPQAGIAPPELEPWYIDVLEMRPMGTARAPVAPPPMAAARAGGEMTIRVGEFVSTYTSGGTLTLPADGSTRVVALDRRRMPAEVRVEVAPKLDPAPYVIAEFSYAGQDPLLPGRVRLRRDGVYVGETSLRLTAPGARLTLGFGRDDKVEVEHRFDLESKSREGIFDDYRRIERRWVTRIRNRHRVPMTIVLYDRFPVPQDERITVELLRDGTPPTSRDVDGRRGVLAWRYRYAPNEERAIRFGFAVSYPAELEIGGL